MAATTTAKRGGLSDADALQAVIDAFVHVILAQCRLGVIKEKDLQAVVKAAPPAQEKGI